jgi:hypothetical protein
MMTKSESKIKGKKPAGSVRRLQRARLEKLIAEALIDCYNQSEEATGLFTALEENLSLPFTGTVLGIKVKVEKVDLDKGGTIVAVCSSNLRRQRIRILDLCLPDPPPAGPQWIEAYRLWYMQG